MIVLQPLRKQRALLSSFCRRKKQRTPVIVAVALWATPRFPQGSGDRIPCLNFADAPLVVLDLTIAHENLELSHRSSCYRNCRHGAARSKRGSSGSRARHRRFARKQSLSPLPALGAAWRACHSVSVCRDSVWSPVFRDRPDLCSRR